MRTKFNFYCLATAVVGLLANLTVAHANDFLDSLVYPGGTIAAAVSPDGKHIAAITFEGSLNTLVLGDAETLKFKSIQKARPNDIPGYHSQNPFDVEWISNDLMAVEFSFGAASINLQGNQVSDLGSAYIGKVKDDDPDSTFVLAYAKKAGFAISRIDARTGTRKTFAVPENGWPTTIAFDAQGEPRAVSLVSDDRWTSNAKRSNWYKADAQSEWVKLAEFNPGEEAWVPLYVPNEPNSLVVSSRLERDTYAVFEYDTNKKALGTMMAGSPEVDVWDVRGIQNNFRRVTVGGMKPQHIWFDNAWAGIQASVDAALPNRTNTLSGNPKKKVVIFSASDTDPGSWYLLDMEKNTLRRFGRLVEKVDPAKMQPMKVISYPARDGLKIPAYLTVPAGTPKMLPAVLLVHGGPIARDSWSWNRTVQALASRGYAVLQPQFRGSAGFGRKFQEAGYGQWGLAMQDDITDGVNYLVNGGIADPGRICIVGSSYGGYAALSGLVKTPDLFKCGISFAGVTDLNLLLTDWSDSNDFQYTRDLMRNTIGDIKAHKEKFDQVSPLKNAHKIKAPVLLMHGDRDERVPISHGTKMRDALERAGKTVVWEEFPTAGHSLRTTKNQQRYLELITEFLRKYIGDSSGPPAPN